MRGSTIFEAFTHCFDIEFHNIKKLELAFKMVEFEWKAAPAVIMSS